MSYYRQLDIDTRVALWIDRNRVWLARAFWGFALMAALAVACRWAGLGAE